MNKTNSEVNDIKKDLTNVEKRIVNASYEIDELGQYLRRDCLCAPFLKISNITYSLSHTQNNWSLEIKHYPSLCVQNSLPSYNLSAVPLLYCTLLQLTIIEKNNCFSIYLRSDLNNNCRKNHPKSI